MSSATVPTVTVYNKGTRTFLRLAHARHDLVIDKEYIPAPFLQMLEQYGTAEIPSVWLRPKDLSKFIPTEDEKAKAERIEKEAKEKAKKAEKKKNRPFWGRKDRAQEGAYAHFDIGQLVVPMSLRMAAEMHMRMEQESIDPNNLPPNMYLDSNGEPKMLPSTPLIKAMMQYHHGEPIQFGKKIRKLFLSHLKFIRQDVEGAMYGESNPDLTHDPLNDGTPDNPERS